MQNQVLSSYTALVNGKVTGFAGCNRVCDRDCLRRDAKLSCRWTPDVWGSTCPYFFPKGGNDADDRQSGLDIPAVV